GQLLLESTIWLFISRGRSQQLLKLLLSTFPLIVGSFAIGLPFGIKGVALFGSLILLVVFPLILKSAFRGTNLSLQRLGQALRYPVLLCLAGVVSGECVLHLLDPRGLGSQLCLVALTFAVAYSLAALIPVVRDEVLSLKSVFRE